MESFDFNAFDADEYNQATNDKVVSETVANARYPNDEPDVGKGLRFAQQYFFVSCSLQEMLHLFVVAHLARRLLIGEDGGERERMRYLATVCRHAINGVETLHSGPLQASAPEEFFGM